MNDLTNINIVQNIMKKHKINFNKKFGQNFMTDASIVERIVEEAQVENGNVLEIGPGLGTMTRSLCNSSKKVVAVEIDKGLIRVLEETLAEFDNVTVIHGDILKMDLPKLALDEFLCEPIHIVANLPYYITTPIIMNILESELAFLDITVMIQKEVAQRMCAVPGTKAYGALSIAVQFYTDSQILFHVPPHSFVPQPNVESTVIKLTPKVEKYHVSDRVKFFKVVSAAFCQRRKTLVNAIFNSGNFQISKEDLILLLNKLEIGASVRGEALNIEEFCKICEEIY